MPIIVYRVLERDLHFEHGQKLFYKPFAHPRLGSRALKVGSSVSNCTLAYKYLY